MDIVVRPAEAGTFGGFYVQAISVKLWRLVQSNYGLPGTVLEDCPFKYMVEVRRWLACIVKYGMLA